MGLWGVGTAHRMHLHGTGRDARDAASPAIGGTSWGQPGQEEAEGMGRLGSKSIASVNYLSLLLLPIKRSV